MNICPACGVELGDSELKCPLCGAVIPGIRDDLPTAAYPDRVFNAENKERITSSEVRKIIVEIITVSCMIAFAVSLPADVFINAGITWSRYTMLSVAAGWVFLCMPLILAGRPWITYSVVAPTSALFVFLLDIFDGRLEWFPLLGLPLVILGTGTWAAVMGLCLHYREKGLNVVATMLSGITLMLIAVEAVINVSVYRAFSLSWSVVMSFATLPVSIFCFYLHYRITKKASLRKLFRL